MFFFEHCAMDCKNLFHVFKLSNQSFPVHLHHAYEIIFVTQGKLQVSIEQQTMTLTANDTAFICSDQLHSMAPDGQCELYLLIFAPDLVPDFHFDMEGYVPQNNLLHLSEPLNLSRFNARYGQKSFLYGMCDQLLQSTELIHKEVSSKMQIFQQILTYVNRHYKKISCSLKQVSEIIQYDYTYLSKLFSQLAAMSFTKYVNHYRISQACYLLRTSEYSISDISEYCGYHNLRTFHRNFLVIQGCSPSAYLLSNMDLPTIAMGSV